MRGLRLMKTKKIIKNLLTYFIVVSILVENLPTTVFAVDTQPNTTEPKIEQPEQEQSKADEPKQDESKTDEPKQDEPKVEALKQSESTQEQPKVDEPKKEDTKVNTYKVVFFDTIAEKNIAEVVVEENKAAESPKEIPEHEGYKFKEWSEDFSKITKDITVKTVYEEIKEEKTEKKTDDENKEDKKLDENQPMYKVVYFDTISKEVILEKEVNEGDKVEAPEPPKHEGFIFKGWTDNSEKIETHMTISTIYEVVQEDIEPEKPEFDESIDGVTIKADEGILPEGTEIKVSECDVSTIEKKVENYKGQDGEVEELKVYDISLEKDGDDVEFEGSVEVIVSADVSNCDEVFAFYKNGDSIEYLPATKVDGGVRFNATHFSEYGVGGLAREGSTQKVFFEPRGGSVAYTEAVVEDGKVSLPIPTKEDCLFLGWFTAENIGKGYYITDYMSENGGRNQINTGADNSLNIGGNYISSYKTQYTVPTTENMTLYAGWAYKVTYDSCNKYFDSRMDGFTAYIAEGDSLRNIFLVTGIVNRSHFRADNTWTVEDIYYDNDVWSNSIGDGILFTELTDNSHAITIYPRYEIPVKFFTKRYSRASAVTAVNTTVTDLSNTTVLMGNTVAKPSNINHAFMGVEGGGNEFNFDTVIDSSYVKTACTYPNPNSNVYGFYLQSGGPARMELYQVIYSIRVESRVGTVNTSPVDVERGDKVPVPIIMGTNTDALIGWHLENYTNDTLWDFDKTLGYPCEIPNYGLLARWGAVVKFDTDGGTPIPDNQIVRSIYQVEDEVVLPTDVNKPNYEFAGWFYNDRDTSKNWVDGWYNGSYDATEITLVAHWTPLEQYTVTFDTDGGNTIGSQTIYKNGKASRPDDPIKSGHTFSKWVVKETNEDWDFDTAITTNINLKAIYTVNPPSTYTVTFNSNGGSAVDSQTITEGSLVTKPTNPIKEGNIFSKWIKSDSTEWDFDNDTVSDDTTLYAVWTVNHYDVTFDSNGGSVVSTQNIEHGQLVARPTNPIKEGSSFVKWVKDDNTEWDFNNDTVTSETTLHAVWNINVYSVTFDSDGGSAVATQNIEHGQKAAQPMNPIKENYKFSKWVKKSDNSDFDFDTVITDNVELKAIWTPYYTVTFNSNGGTAVTSQSILMGNPIVKPSNPTKLGHTFEKWVKDDNTDWNFDTDTVIGALNLNAVWSINSYEVTFNTNGGSSVPTQTIEYGNKVVKPANPIKAHNTFVRWEKNGIAWNFDNNTVTESFVLVAKWQLDKHTVTLNANGGLFSGAETTTRQVEYGKKLNKDGLPTPTREGYVLEGWYRDAAGNTEFNFDDSIVDNIEIYAKWKVAKYYVTFNSNGGSSVPYQYIEHGKKAVKPSDPTREGYTFKGWFKSSGNEYDFNNAVTTNIVLYAKWEQNSSIPTPTPIVPKPTPIVPKPIPKPIPTPIIPKPLPTPEPIKPIPKPIIPIIPEPEPEPRREPEPQHEPEPQRESEPQPTVQVLGITLPIETADEFESDKDLTKKKYTYVESHEMGYKNMNDARIVKDLYKVLSQRTEEEKLIYRYKRQF